MDFATFIGGQFVGDFMLICSGVAWALFMVYNKKFIMNSTSATFPSMPWVLVITLLSIVPFTLLFGAHFFELTTSAWLAIVYTAIVCWVFPYYLWLEGLKHLSASTSTVLLLSEIVVAVTVSVIVFKEPVTVFSTIGTLLIVVAIALVSVRDKRIDAKNMENKSFPRVMLKLKYIEIFGLGDKKWQKL